MNPIEDLENKAVEFFEQREFLVSFLLFHTLTEALLRAFLRKGDKETRFSNLVKDLESFLCTPPYAQPRGSVQRTIKQLTEYNQFRNRIIHNLWKHGYSRWNILCKEAARQAYIIYLLTAEYLETFSDELNKYHFAGSKRLKESFHTLLSDYKIK